jgi:hypothetical protein
VAVGNAQAEALGIRSADAKTTPAQLASLVLREPRLIGPVFVFGVTTVLARSAARPRVRRGDFTTWLRDESSRTP